MAGIGLRNLEYAVLKSDGTYETPAAFGRAITATVTPNVADAKLHADDNVAESDSSVVDAAVTFEVADQDAKVLAPLLGHELNGTEVLRKTTDMPPYVGIARIVPMIEDGVRSYHAEFLPKVKFKQPNQENATKADGVEFKTTSIEGTAIGTGDDLWSKGDTFATVALAKAYIASCFNVVVEPEE